MNSTAVNSETIVPMPSVKREALDAGGGEPEEDERRDQGDHVRVDDRRDALAVALGDRRQHRSARARTSSFIRSKMTTFESAATPIVRIRPAMPGSVSVIGISLISARKKRA